MRRDTKRIERAKGVSKRAAMGTPIAKQRDRGALFERLEARQMLAANLHMISSYWGDNAGNAINNVAVGTQPNLWVNYNVEGIPAGTFYRIRATVGGETRDLITNQGAGAGAMNIKANIGRVMVPDGWFLRQVKLDHDNDVAETDELDNTHTINTKGQTFTPKFALPLEGTPWVDWSLGNYVDVDLASGDNHKFDYHGGTFTYDGHNGWDIGPANWRAGDEGIDIRAAAAGTVVEMNEDAYDRNYVADGQPSNYMIIDHGGGWRTIYHHMRKNSIPVSVGDTVTEGQVIGLMGSSGNSTGVHLHWAVTYNGMLVEPMVGESSYMKTPIGYSADHPTILDAGVTSYSLNIDELVEGPTQADRFLTTGGSRTVRSWASFGGVNNGDTIAVKWFQPGGAQFASNSWSSGQIQGGYLTQNLNLPSPAASGTWQVAWYINGAEKARNDFFVSTVAQPQVKMTRGGNYIVDNRSTPWDFGKVKQGQTALPTMTFQVWNNGAATLNTSNLTVPAGFTVTEGLSSSIAAGSFDNFTVRLDSATVAYRNGYVSFSTNDPDFHETFMRFRIEGEVEPLALTGGVLDDDIYIKRSGANAQIWVNKATNLAPSYELPVASTGLLEIDTFGGNDTLTVDMSGGYPLQSGLAYDGGTGNDKFRLLGGTGNDIFTVRGDQASWGIMPGMQYFSAETVEVFGGAGADVVSLSTAGVGDIDNIDHDVRFDGGDGNDTVNVHDRNDIGDTHDYLLSDLYFDRAGFFGALYYPDVETLNINTANDADLVKIRGVAAGTTANFSGGNGNDTFIVGEFLNHTDRIYGSVSIKGDAGTDGIEYRDNGNIALSTPDAYSITSDTIARTDSGAVGYDQTVESLRLLASGESSSININSTNPTTALSVNAGADKDWINVTESAVPVVIEPASGDDTVNVNTTGIGNASAVFNQTQTIGSLIVGDGGVATVAPGGDKVLVLQGLAVTTSGKLDLADNAMIINYTSSSPMPSVKSMLAVGYNGGAWDGLRMSSSTAASDPNHNTAVGYAEAVDVIGPQGGTFMGQSVDATAVLVRYTRYGDANLDGTVNLIDFNRLAGSFGQSDRTWSQGDFNYDGLINLIDFNRLAGNFGQSL